MEDEEIGKYVHMLSRQLKVKADVEVSNME